MSLKKAQVQADRDKRAGKPPTTQAGEFIREEMHRVKTGDSPARSPKQAVAIGLSEARRAGVEVPPPKPGKASKKTRDQAIRDLKKGRAAEDDGDKH